MLHPSSKDIIEVTVDEQSREHLLDAAKWARFLSVTGLVLAGIMLLLFSYSIWSDGAAAGSTSFLVGSTLGIILVIGLYIYPMVTIFRFSTGIRNGLNQFNQPELMEGLRYLKITFRYLGILLILVLVLYILLFIMMLINHF
ncbi:MAG: hypothetical protein JNM44_05200 [Chitinophagaceae bacterium]|nr:hypothetical protein [Chitinophagaceae bacterium]